MLKQLIRPVRGFKTLKTAYATITGFEVMRTLLLQQSYFEFLIAPVKAAPFARL
jgi:transposase-like protein